MAEPKLQIDERCDKIEAALGTLADIVGEAEVVRAILYGGGEPRGEGVPERDPQGEWGFATNPVDEDREGIATSPEELHIAHDIAKKHHALYLTLAPQYGHTPSSPTSWEDMPETQKNLLVAIIAEMLNIGDIKANRD